MRQWLYIVLAIIVVLAADAHEGSHEFNESVDGFAKLEVEQAILLYGRLKNSHPEAHPHFRDMLLARGDVEEFVTGQLEALPHTAGTGHRRRFFFRVLRSLRTPWAARLCGQYLFSDETIEPPFKTEKEAMDFFSNGGTLTSNSSFALISLERMRIDTAPDVLETYILPEDKKARWREWWSENEGNIEELLARGPVGAPLGKPTDRKGGTRPTKPPAGSVYVFVR